MAKQKSFLNKKTYQEFDDVGSFLNKKQVQEFDTPIQTEDATMKAARGLQQVEQINRGQVGDLLNTSEPGDLPFKIEDYEDYLDIVPNLPVDILDELRAQNQGAGEQVGYGSLKGLARAGTTFAGSFIDLFAIPSAIASGTDAYQNPFEKWADKKLEELEVSLPNYYTKDQRENPLAARNIFSANFIGDKFLKNAGFTVGAIAAGMVGGAALSGISKAVIGASRIGRLGYQASKLAAASAETGTAIAEGSQIAKNLSNIANAYKYAKVGTAIGSSILASRYEAGVEARETGNRLREELKAKGFSDAEIEQDVQDAMDYTYWANIGLLSVSNLGQFGSLFTRGMNVEKSLINPIGRASVSAGEKATSAATKLAKDITHTPITGWGKARKIGAKVGESMLTEGIWEEGGQFTASAAVRQYYDDLYDGKEEVNDIMFSFKPSIMRSIGKGVGETYSTNEGLESVVLGAITGGVFGVGSNISTFKNILNQNKATENIINILKENSIVNERGEFTIKPGEAEDNSIGALLKRSAIQYRNAVKTVKNKENQEKALGEGDILGVEINGYDALANRVRTYSQLGQYDLLIQQLDDLAGLSNEDFNTMFGLDENINQLEYINHIKAKADSIRKVAEDIESVFPINKAGSFYNIPDAKDGDKRAMYLNKREMLFDLILKLRTRELSHDDYLNKFMTNTNSQINILDLLTIQDKKEFEKKLNEELDKLPKDSEAIVNRQRTFEDGQSLYRLATMKRNIAKVYNELTTGNYDQEEFAKYKEESDEHLKQLDAILNDDKVDINVKIGIIKSNIRSTIDNTYLMSELNKRLAKYEGKSEQETVKKGIFQNLASRAKNVAKNIKRRTSKPSTFDTAAIKETQLNSQLKSYNNKLTDDAYLSNTKDAKEDTDAIKEILNQIAENEAYLTELNKELETNKDNLTEEDTTKANEEINRVTNEITTLKTNLSAARKANITSIVDNITSRINEAKAEKEAAQQQAEKEDEDENLKRAKEIISEQEKAEEAEEEVEAPSESAETSELTFEEGIPLLKEHEQTLRNYIRLLQKRLDSAKAAREDNELRGIYFSTDSAKQIVEPYYKKLDLTIAQLEKDISQYTMYLTKAQVLIDEYEGGNVFDFEKFRERLDILRKNIDVKLEDVILDSVFDEFMLAEDNIAESVADVILTIYRDQQDRITYFNVIRNSVKEDSKYKIPEDFDFTAYSAKYDSRAKAVRRISKAPSFVGQNELAVWLKNITDETHAAKLLTIIERVRTEGTVNLTKEEQEQLKDYLHLQTLEVGEEVTIERKENGVDEVAGIGLLNSKFQIHNGVRYTDDNFEVNSWTSDEEIVNTLSKFRSDLLKIYQSEDIKKALLDLINNSKKSELLAALDKATNLNQESRTLDNEIRLEAYEHILNVVLYNVMPQLSIDVNKINIEQNAKRWGDRIKDDTNVAKALRDELMSAGEKLSVVITHLDGGNYIYTKTHDNPANRLFGFMETAVIGAAIGKVESLRNIENGESLIGDKRGYLPRVLDKGRSGLYAVLKFGASQWRSIRLHDTKVNNSLTPESKAYSDKLIAYIKKSFKEYMATADSVRKEEIIKELGKYINTLRHLKINDNGTLSIKSYRSKDDSYNTTVTLDNVDTLDNEIGDMYRHTAIRNGKYIYNGDYFDHVTRKNYNNFKEFIANTHGVSTNVGAIKIDGKVVSNMDVRPGLNNTANNSSVPIPFTMRIGVPGLNMRNDRDIINEIDKFINKESDLSILAKASGVKFMGYRSTVEAIERLGLSKAFEEAKQGGQTAIDDFLENYLSILQIETKGKKVYITDKGITLYNTNKDLFKLTFIHEQIHGILRNKKYKNNAEMQQRLSEFDKSIDKLIAGDSITADQKNMLKQFKSFYTVDGVVDLEEMITYAFSDEGIIRVLNEIETTDEYTPNKRSIWQKLMDLLSRMLNIVINDKSKLAELRNILEDAMRSPRTVKEVALEEVTKDVEESVTETTEENRIEDLEDEEESASLGKTQLDRIRQAREEAKRRAAEKAKRDGKPPKSVTRISQLVSENFTIKQQKSIFESLSISAIRVMNEEDDLKLSSPRKAKELILSKLEMSRESFSKEQELNMDKVTEELSKENSKLWSIFKDYFAKNYKIQIIEEEDIIEDLQAQELPARYNDEQQFKTDIKNKILPQVKLAIALIEIPNTSHTTLLGLNRTIDFDKVFPLLVSQLSELPTQEMKEEKLRALGNHFDPTLLAILDKFENTPIDRTVTADGQEYVFDLKKAFYDTFNIQNPEAIAYNINKGEAEVNVSRKIQNANAFGRYQIADTYTSNILYKLNTSNYRVSKIDKSKTTKELISQIIDTANKIGIDLNEMVFNYMFATDEKLKRYQLNTKERTEREKEILGVFTSALNTLVEEIHSFQERDEFTTIQLSAKDTFKNAILALAKTQEGFTYKLSTSYMNVTGDMYQSPHLDSQFSSIMKILKNPVSAEKYLLDLIKKIPSFIHSNLVVNNGTKENPTGFLDLENGVYTINELFVRNFDYKILSGTTNYSDSITLKHNDMGNFDWNTTVLGAFTKGDLLIPVFSESGRTYAISMPLYKELGLSSARNTAEDLVESASSSTMGLQNIIRFELESATDALSAFEFDGKKIKLKKGLTRQDLVKGREYRLTKAGKLILEENGLPAGKVFRFTELQYKNEKGELVGILEFMKEKGIEITTKNYFDNSLASLLEENMLDFLKNYVEYQIETNRELYKEQIERLIPKADRENVLASFTLNSIIANVEYGMLIGGTASEYENGLDYNKRASQSIKNGISTNSTKQYQSIVVSDILRLDPSLFNIKGFDKQTKAADGHTYITDIELINRLNEFNLSSIYRDAIEAYREGRFDEVESANVIQQLKYFYYNRRFESRGGINRLISDQIKNSTTVIFKNQYPEGSDMAKLYDLMVEEGIGELTFQSTDKLESTRTIELYDKNGKLKSKDKLSKAFRENATLFNYSSLRIQQTTPDHLINAKNKAGIQIMTRIFDDILLDENYSGLRGTDIFNEFQEVYSSIIKNASHKLLHKLGAEFKNGNPVRDDNGNIVVNKEALIDFVNSTIARDSFNYNLIMATTYNSKVTDSNIPIYSTSITNKVLAILTSKFTKNIIDLRLPGFHLPIAPDVFLDIDLESYKDILEGNIGVVKEGVSELFETNSELSNIGTQEQYSKYLDTIFPNSKVKDIVYHGTNTKIDTFDKSKANTSDEGYFGKGFYFGGGKRNAKIWAERAGGNVIISALINLTNPTVINQYENGKINKELRGKEVENGVIAIWSEDGYNHSTNEYVVSNSEQIHILGSKQDIAGFKQWVSKTKVDKTERNIAFNEKANIEYTSEKIDDIIANNGENRLKANSIKDGKIIEAEILIPRYDSRFFDNNGDPIPIDVLKESGVLDGIQYRIPTEGLQSMFTFKVVGFIKGKQSKVIIPTAVVQKSGADFDIDTMYAILPNLKASKEGVNKIQYKTEGFTDTDRLEYAKEILQLSDKDKIVELYKKYNKRIVDLFKSKKQIGFVGKDKIKEIDKQLRIDELNAKISKLSEQGLVDENDSTYKIVKDLHIQLELINEDINVLKNDEEYSSLSELQEHKKTLDYILESRYYSSNEYSHLTQEERNNYDNSVRSYILDITDNKFDTYDGFVQYLNTLDNSESAKLNRLLSLRADVREVLSLVKNTDLLKSITNSKEFKDNVNEIKTAKQSKKELNNQIIELRKQRTNEINEILDRVISKEDYDKLSAVDKNPIKAKENRIYELMRMILDDPKSFESLYKINDFENLQEAVSTLSARGNKQYNKNNKADILELRRLTIGTADLKGLSVSFDRTLSILGKTQAYLKDGLTLDISFDQLKAGLNITNKENILEYLEAKYGVENVFRSKDGDYVSITFQHIANNRLGDYTDIFGNKISEQNSEFTANILDAVKSPMQNNMHPSTIYLVRTIFALGMSSINKDGMNNPHLYYTALLEQQVFTDFIEAKIRGNRIVDKVPFNFKKLENDLIVRYIETKSNASTDTILNKLKQSANRKKYINMIKADPAFNQPLTYETLVAELEKGRTEERNSGDYLAYQFKLLNLIKKLVPISNTISGLGFVLNTDKQAAGPNLRASYDVEKRVFAKSETLEEFLDMLPIEVNEEEIFDEYGRDNRALRSFLNDINTAKTDILLRDKMIKVFGVSERDINNSVFNSDEAVLVDVEGRAIGFKEAVYSNINAVGTDSIWRSFEAYYQNGHKVAIDTISQEFPQFAPFVLKVLDRIESKTGKLDDRTYMKLSNYVVRYFLGDKVNFFRGLIEGETISQVSNNIGRTLGLEYVEGDYARQHKNVKIDKEASSLSEFNELSLAHKIKTVLASDNTLLQSTANELLSSFNIESGDKYKVPYERIFLNDISDTNYYTGLFEDLFSVKEPVGEYLKSIGRDLIVYSFITSGFEFTLNQLNNIISSQVLLDETNIANQYRNAKRVIFENDFTDDDINMIEEAIYKAFHDDSRLVPIASSTKIMINGKIKSDESQPMFRRIPEAKEKDGVHTGNDKLNALGVIEEDANKIRFSRYSKADYIIVNRNIADVNEAPVFVSRFYKRVKAKVLGEDKYFYYPINRTLRSEYNNTNISQFNESVSEQDIIAAIKDYVDGGKITITGKSSIGLSRIKHTTKGEFNNIKNNIESSIIDNNIILSDGSEKYTEGNNITIIDEKSREQIRAKVVSVRELGFQQLRELPEDHAIFVMNDYSKQEMLDLTANKPNLSIVTISNQDPSEDSVKSVTHTSGKIVKPTHTIGKTRYTGVKYNIIWSGKPNNYQKDSRVLVQNEGVNRLDIEEASNREATFIFYKDPSKDAESAIQYLVGKGYKQTTTGANIILSKEDIGLIVLAGLHEVASVLSKNEVEYHNAVRTVNLIKDRIVGYYALGKMFNAGDSEVRNQLLDTLKELSSYYELDFTKDYEDPETWDKLQSFDDVAIFEALNRDFIASTKLLEYAKSVLEQLNSIDIIELNRLAEDPTNQEYKDSLNQISTYARNLHQLTRIIQMLKNTSKLNKIYINDINNMQTQSNNIIDQFAKEIKPAIDKLENTTDAITKIFIASRVHAISNNPNIKKYDIKDTEQMVELITALFTRNEDISLAAFMLDNTANTGVAMVDNLIQNFMLMYEDMSREQFDLNLKLERALDKIKSEIGIRPQDKVPDSLRKEFEKVFKEKYIYKNPDGTYSNTIHTEFTPELQRDYKELKSRVAIEQNKENNIAAYREAKKALNEWEEANIERPYIDEYYREQAEVEDYLYLNEEAARRWNEIYSREQAIRRNYGRNRQTFKQEDLDELKQLNVEKSYLLEEDNKTGEELAISEHLNKYLDKLYKFLDKYYDRDTTLFQSALDEIKRRGNEKELLDFLEKNTSGVAQEFFDLLRQHSDTLRTKKDNELKELQKEIRRKYSNSKKEIDINRIPAEKLAKLRELELAQYDNVLEQLNPHGNQIINAYTNEYYNKISAKEIYGEEYANEVKRVRTDINNILLKYTTRGVSTTSLESNTYNAALISKEDIKELVGLTNELQYLKVKYFPKDAALKQKEVERIKFIRNNTTNSVSVLANTEFADARNAVLETGDPELIKAWDNYFSIKDNTNYIKKLDRLANDLIKKEYNGIAGTKPVFAEYARRRKEEIFADIQMTDLNTLSRLALKDATGQIDISLATESDLVNIRSFIVTTKDEKGATVQKQVVKKNLYEIINDPQFTDFHEYTDKVLNKTNSTSLLRDKLEDTKLKLVENIEFTKSYIKLINDSGNKKLIDGLNSYLNKNITYTDFLNILTDQLSILGETGAVNKAEEDLLKHHYINSSATIMPMSYLIEMDYDGQEMTPNPTIWGDTIPNKEYIDHEKRNAMLFFRSGVTYVESEDYRREFAKARELDRTNPGSFNQWFNENHVYNPYRHKFEPLSIYTRMMPTNRDYLGKSPVSGWNKYTVRKSYENPNKKTTRHLEPKGDKYRNPAYDNLKDDETYKTIVDILTNIYNTNGRFPSRYFQSRSNWMSTQEYFGLKKQKTNVVKNVGLNGEIFNILQFKSLKPIENRPVIAIPKRIKLDRTYQEYENRALEILRTKGHNFSTLDDVREENKKIEAENRKEHSEKALYDPEFVLNSYIKEALRYKLVKSVEDEFAIFKKQMDDVTFIGRNSLTSETIKDRFQSIFTKSNKVANDKDRILVKEALNDFIKHKLYGEVESSKLDPVVNFLMQLTSMKTMVFNVTAAIKNVNKGFIDIVYEAKAKEFLETSDLKFGLKKYQEGIKYFLANDGYRSTNLVEGIVKTYHSILDTHDVGERSGNMSKEMKSILDRAYTYVDKSYFLMNSTEHFLHYTMMLAMMNSHRIVNGKIMSFHQYEQDVRGDILKDLLTEDEKIALEKERQRIEREESEKSLTTRIDYIGKFAKKILKDKARRDEYVKRKEAHSKQAREEFNSFETFYNQHYLENEKAQVKTTTNQREISKFIRKVRSVNYSLHGIYSQIDRNIIQEHSLGRASMQFRKWIVPNWNRWYGIRFGKSQFNEGLQSYSEPAMWNWFKYMTSPIRDNIFDQTEEGESKLHLKGLKNIIRDYRDFIGNAKFYFHTLDKYEQASIRRVNQSMMYILGTGILSTVLIYFLGKSDDDDEKITEITKALLLYETLAVYTELSEFTPVVGWYTLSNQLLQYPTPSTRSIADYLDLIWELLKFPFTDDEARRYEGGFNNGEYRLNVKAMKNLPYFREYYKFMNLYPMTRYYRLHNRMIVNIER